MIKLILVYTIIIIGVLFLLSRTPNTHNKQQQIHTAAEEEDFNVTNRIARLFPEIDVDPTDQFVSVHELTQWNVHHVQQQILHRSQKEMVVYDKNRDGFVSFSEFGLSTSTSDGDPFGYDMRLLEEEHFNASDVDGDGLLNLAEFNDFLHPADSNNPKLQQWLCKEEVRERDTDRDGKVSFREFFYGLYDLVNNYDEKSYNDSHHSDDSIDASAKVLFSQLDKDFDGYLSDIELLPIIGKVHPSGHYYATKQAEYLMSQAQIDNDGRLNLTEMIDNAYTLFVSIFPDEFF